MGATINSVTAAEYTWDTAASITWDGAEATRGNWTSMPICAHTAALDDPLTFAEVGGRSSTKRLAEAFTAADMRRSGVGKRPMEAFAFADALKSANGFMCRLAESLGVSDGVMKAFGANESEAIRVAEKRASGMTMVEREAFSMTSSSKSWATFVRTMAEAFAVSEKGARGVGRRAKETLAISEAWADQVTFIRGFAESLSVAESYQDNINFILRCVEALSVSDRGASGIGKRPREAFAVAEKRAAGFALAETESLAFADAMTDVAAFYLRFAESVSTSDAVGKSANAVRKESFRLVESKIAKASAKRLSEALAALDVLGRRVSFKRSLTEGFRAVDAIRKAAALKPAEALRLGDELVRGASGVIDEVGVLSTIMSDEEFARMLETDAPAEFSEFRKMLPGDYEYTEAIVRVIAFSQTSDRARIENFNHLIDVPDVIDRGRVSCSAGSGAVVTFNRDFIEPPEVSLTIAGGAAGVTLIPRVVGPVTTAGFTVAIYKTDGTLADGVVSWTATGY